MAARPELPGLGKPGRPGLDVLRPNGCPPVMAHRRLQLGRRWEAGTRGTPLVAVAPLGPPPVLLPSEPEHCDVGQRGWKGSGGRPGRAGGEGEKGRRRRGMGRGGGEEGGEEGGGGPPDGQQPGPGRGGRGGKGKDRAATGEARFPPGEGLGTTETRGPTLHTYGVTRGSKRVQERAALGGGLQLLAHGESASWEASSARRGGTRPPWPDQPRWA